ncbi:hypothetical protein BGW37DRAFT_482263 [Umbelopsis sp. PMI_123]|nr:hypothetical protein BGW37DRAFT_482263 [Umbelopsis sp. PMI_123]
MFSKGSTSSCKNEDSTLELINQYPQSSKQAEKSSFRTANILAQSNTAVENEWFDFSSNTSGNAPFTPQMSKYKMAESPFSEYAHLDDSYLVQELLHSRDYTETVYSPSPQTFITNTPVSPEQSNLYLANLLAAENIEKYLSQTTYSDDVYALPVYFQQLIREAKEEIAENESKPDNSEHVRTALSRLQMVREQLLSQDRGDIRKASALKNLNKDDLEGIWKYYS